MNLPFRIVAKEEMNHLTLFSFGPILCL